MLTGIRFVCKEENIRKMKDAELEAALKEDYADDDTPEE